MFIDAWLALGTVVSGQTFTELSAPGYGRQPISFGPPRNGLARSTTPYSFLRVPQLAGRALFTAKTGGTCLLTMPYPAVTSFGSLPEAGDAGEICLLFNDIVGDPSGATGTFNYVAGVVIGTCWQDPRDFSGMSPALNNAGQTIPGGPVKVFNTGLLTCAQNITISRGILQAAGTGEA